MVDENEQVSWNLSQQISNQIGYLIQQGSTYSLSGKEMDSYFCFKEISILIHHHLTDKEKADIFEKEKQINYALTELNKSLKTAKNDEFEVHSDKDLNKLINQLKAKKYVSILEYKKLILFLLDAYGYLMERKRDKSKMF